MKKHSETRQPTDTLILSLSRDARTLLLEEARWQRQMADPFDLVGDLERIAAGSAVEIFEGLAKLAGPPASKQGGGA